MSDMDKITSLSGLWALTFKATFGAAVLKTSPKMLRTVRKRVLQGLTLALLVWAFMSPYSAGHAIGTAFVVALCASPFVIIYKVGRKRGARHSKKA